MFSKRVRKKGFVLVYIIIIFGFCIVFQLFLIKLIMDIKTNYEIKGKEIKHYKIN